MRPPPGHRPAGCRTTALPGTRPRRRRTYIIEGDGRRTVHTLERPRFFHGFDQVRADLTAAGFSVDAEGDGGRPDPTLPVTARRITE